MAEQHCAGMASVEVRARAMTFPDSDVEEKIMERVRTSVSTVCTMGSMQTDEPVDESGITACAFSKCFSSTDPGDPCQELEAFLAQEQHELEAYFGSASDNGSTSADSHALHDPPFTPRASSECSGLTEMEDRNEELQAFLFQERLEIEAHFGSSEDKRDASTESGEARIRSLLPLSGQYSNDHASPHGALQQTLPVLLMPMVMCQSPQSPQSHQQDGSLSAKGCSDCPVVSPCSTTSWSPQRNNRKRTRQQKKTVRALAQYIAVRCDACTRQECRVENRRTGTFHQKCHCRISQCVDDMVKVHYMNGEHEDEWLSLSDPRIFNSQDEHWCEHGKVCNHMVRRGKCQRQSSGCDTCSGESQRCDACQSHALSFCHLDSCVRLQQKHASTKS